eukprot:845058-Prorocentrum_minimum.AAC.1
MVQVQRTVSPFRTVCTAIRFPPTSSHSLCPAWRPSRSATWRPLRLATWRTVMPRWLASAHAVSPSSTCASSGGAPARGISSTVVVYIIHCCWHAGYRQPSL